MKCLIFSFAFAETRETPCISQYPPCGFNIETNYNDTPGNAASIFLLTRKELHSFFNQLLAALCLFDLVYLLTMLLEALRNLGLETAAHIILFSHFLYPLNAIAMMGSIYMTMVVGLER